MSLCLPEFRDRGVRTKLIEKLIEKAQQESLQVVRLKSRITAIDFYKKIGFSEQGEFFEYLTIPHINMQIKLEYLSYKCLGKGGF